MANNSSLLKEIKGLGQDLVKAAKTMRSSQEFKTLERDVSKTIKSLSNSMVRSFKSAQKSPSTKKIARRLKRVLKEGSKQGKIEAQKAQLAATKGIKKARVALKKVINKRKKGG